MPAYDRSYSPPAPVAAVTVIHPVTGLTSGALPGKLDTGAAMTVMPQQTAAQLTLSPHREVWARGYDGNYARRAVYFVRLVMEGHELGIVQCLAAHRSTVLVGRDVLNQFLLTLDGKNLRFEMKRV